MNIGLKIKNERIEKGLSQEALALKMNVSRSAIAKWETNKGLPDISNIITLSRVFSMSIDDLLKDEVLTQEENDLSYVTVADDYIGKKCSIEVNGWNNGVYDAFIKGEDKDFIFYTFKEKKQTFQGAISKIIITAIKVNKNKTIDEDFEVVDRKTFIGKNVSVHLKKRKGFIAGFFDFRDDDYRDVKINDFHDKVLDLNFGGSIEINRIGKIEEKE